MAQLKDTVVAGNLRVTSDLYTTTLQVTSFEAPTSSGGATFGTGSNNQVLKSNGTTVYWAADNNSTGYVALNQGSGNSGKFLVVNSSGVVTPTALSSAI